MERGAGPALEEKTLVKPIPTTEMIYILFIAFSV
jgi:hypothetical protein